MSLAFFFDGNEKAFSGLRFHLDKEEFAFYSPVYMKDDPLWIDVSDVMQQGNDGVGEYVSRLSGHSDLGAYIGRINQILGIRDIQLHIEEVTGEDKTIEVVVDIFNRVNSGGTKLSKGDLALAKICADWPEARDRMKDGLTRWSESDYHFDLDWLLRCMNAIITGEAKFLHLHDVAADRVDDGLRRAERGIDSLLNIISGRLGLDHHRVFFGRYALPVMVHYLDRRGGHLEDAAERDKLLYWYLHAAMEWVERQGLPEGELCFELADQDTGDPVAMFDLAWEKGLQEGLSQPVALLLNEPPEILALANAHGFRNFTDVESFKRYVTEEILAIHEPEAAVAAM